MCVNEVTGILIVIEPNINFYDSFVDFRSESDV